MNRQSFNALFPRSAVRIFDGFADVSMDIAAPPGQVTIDWGDGTDDSHITITAGEGVTPPSPDNAHDYRLSGEYAVTVTVIADDTTDFPDPMVGHTYVAAGPPVPQVAVPPAQIVSRGAEACGHGAGHRHGGQRRPAARYRADWRRGAASPAGQQRPGRSEQRDRPDAPNNR